MRNLKFFPKLVAGLAVGALLLLPHAIFPQATLAEREFLFAQKLYNDALHSLAAEQLREFAERFPNDSRADHALLMSGLAYAAVDEFDNAFDRFKALELSYPQSQHLAESRFQMAACQSSLGEHKAAAELFRRVPYFHPQSDRAALSYLNAGRAYLASADLNGAVSSFMKVAADYPDSPLRIDAQLEVVRAYMGIDSLDRAIHEIDGIFRAFGSEVKDARVYWLRGQIFEALGNFDEAVRIYEKLIASFPGAQESRLAQYHLADYSRNKGDLSAALSKVDAFLQSRTGADTLLTQAHLLRGDILAADEKPDDAIDAYRQALDGAPSDLRAELGYKIARQMMLGGNLQGARQALSQVVHGANENDASEQRTKGYLNDAYLMFIDVTAQMGQTGDALRFASEYKRRFAGSENMPGVLFREARIIENGATDYTRAQRAYQTVLDTFPGCYWVDESKAAIGRCYEKLGEYRLALVEYQDYLRRFPAGDEYDVVAEKADLIARTVQLQPQAGNAGFARILSQGVSGIEPAKLALELGKVHLKAKGFDSAIAMLHQAMAEAAPNGDDLVLPETQFYLGQSHLLKAQRLQLAGDDAGRAAHTDSAVSAFHLLQSSFPENDHFAETQLRLVELALTRQDSLLASQDALGILKTWDADYPQHGGSEAILNSLADGYFDLVVAGDSTLADSAVKYYEESLRRFPEQNSTNKIVFNMARIWETSGRDSLALQALNSVLSTNMSASDHQTGPALLLRSAILRRSGQLDAARNDLRKVEREFFYSDIAKQARIALAELEFERGNYQSALDLYRRHLRDNRLDKSDTHAAAADAGSIYMQARSLDMLGLFDDALSSYLEFLRTHPTAELAEAARLAVARIAALRGNKTFAAEYYRAVLDGGRAISSRFQAAMALGSFKFEQKLYQDARERFQVALSLAGQPEMSRQAEREIIRCGYRLREFAAADAAVKSFKKAYRDTKKDEAQFLLDKAETYKVSKRFELARKSYKQLKNDYDKTEFGPQGEFGLGAVDLITNHTDDALKVLTGIPGKYPKSSVTPLAYFNLGDFYYKSQQIQNAIHAFKQVVAHPKAGEYRGKGLLYLIQCYRDAGMLDIAVSTTRDYLARYPQSEHSFRKKIDLAQLLMNLKEYGRAIDQLQLLLPHADNTTEAEIQFYIAQSYKERGDFRKAASEFLKVKYLTKPSKLPWHVTALFETGRCFLRLNETAQARTIFERILREQGSTSNFGRFALKQLQSLETNSSSASLEADSGQKQ